MKIKLEREIERINRLERQWKMKTSEDKFKIIPIAQYNTEQITVNGKNLNTSKEGKFLGLQKNRIGKTRNRQNQERQGRFH